MIEDVVVDESARGRGVGTALTAEAARLAQRSRGQARQLDVATVEGGGEPSCTRGPAFVQRETNVYRKSIGTWKAHRSRS